MVSKVCFVDKYGLRLKTMSTRFFYTLWKKVDFSPISCKNIILYSKWTLLKSCCFFLISLRSIKKLAYDFKSPFLDIEITISNFLKSHNRKGNFWKDISFFLFFVILGDPWPISQNGEGGELESCSNGTIGSLRLLRRSRI